MVEASLSSQNYPRALYFDNKVNELKKLSDPRLSGNNFLPKYDLIQMILFNLIILDFIGILLHENVKEKFTLPNGLIKRDLILIDTTGKVHIILSILCVLSVTFLFFLSSLLDNLYAVE